MKWINIPEGTESVGSACTGDGACVCVCVCVHVGRQLREIRVHNCLRPQAEPPFLFYARTQAVLTNI